MIVIGLLIWIAEHRRVGDKSMDKISWGDGLAIGAAQALSVVPGTSRSGITITAGLFRGLNRETAARFSFLLSTPAIAAAVAKKLWDIHKEGGMSADMRVPFALGAGLSGILGAVVIAFFLRYLRRSSLMPFVYYRIIFGIIVIALAAFFRFNAG
jgi:undecaprenyl-diphosphatase